MSVEEISRATRIPVVSIERIEADHFDDLPGEVFVRGFIKAYARAVALSVDEVLQRLVHAARELAGARYAALGIPDGEGGFRRFLV